MSNTVIIRTLLVFVAMFLFPLAFVPRVAAQADVSRDSQEFEARRAVLNRVGENHDTTPCSRHQVAAPRLIELKRIRAISSGLTQASSRGETLDLRFVARSANEIKKRARRLQVSLRFSAGL